MAEQQRDLGRTPEDRTEHQPDFCPACERQFTKLEDFPRVQVEAVSIVSSDDIPSSLPHWWEERLRGIDATQAGVSPIIANPEWKGISITGKLREIAVVPPEVVEYFSDNPGVETFVHSDSYIYERPYQETLAYRKSQERLGNARVIGGDEYKRRFNWSPAIKSLLTESPSLQAYLATLKGFEGQETKTANIFPQWDRYRLPGISGKRMGYTIPENNRLQIYLTDPYPTGENYDELDANKAAYEAQKKTGVWRAEIGLWSDGPNFGSVGGPSIQRVIGIGQIAYQGRINKA